MDWHTPAPLDQIPFDPAEVFAAGLRNHHIANTAYPIGHITTMRPYRVSNREVQATARAAWEGIDRLGLYVHIPFCETRCGYCEYTVIDPAQTPVHAGLHARYADLLRREFALYRQALGTGAKTLIGFDIGGGTPSAVDPAHIAALIEAAHGCFNLPPSVTISLETTPKIAALEPHKLRAYYALGIRRISMGVQTTNLRLLAEVGRTATSLTYNCQAAANIREAGFQRFNVDLMYGFARQPLASLEATLQHVFSLEPEYITLYRMRYKGTRIAGQAGAVALGDVNTQYDRLKTLLHAAGYEGSPGKNTFSRLPGEPGTSDYLTERVINGTPYLGLGLGAQSLAQHTLAYNSGAADKQLRLYEQKVNTGLLPIQDLYHLSLPAAVGKMISVSFYFGEINLAAFERKFGLALEQAFPAETAYVLAQGLMEYAQTGPDPTLRLTETGAHQVNGVIALFYAGAVKSHLINLPLPGGCEGASGR